MTFFNTTIQFAQLYIELSEQGTAGKRPKLIYSEIEGLYRFIHNRAITILIDHHVLDPYCRLGMGYWQACCTLSEHYSQNDTTTKFHQMNLEELLAYDIIAGNCGTPLPGWAQLYPRPIVELALYHIDKKVEQQRLYLPRVRQSDRDFFIEVPFEKIRQYSSGISTYHDVTENRLGFEIPMQNLFGNNVTFVMCSNTNRTDDFINVMEHFKSHELSKIAFGRNKSLEKESKLLFTAIYTLKGVNIPHDYPVPREVVQEADCQVGP